MKAAQALTAHDSGRLECGDRIHQGTNGSVMECQLRGAIIFCAELPDIAAKTGVRARRLTCTCRILGQRGTCMFKQRALRALEAAHYTGRNANQSG